MENLTFTETVEQLKDYVVQNVKDDVQERGFSLIDLMVKHTNKKSRYMKMMDLSGILTIIKILGVLFAVIFVCALFSEYLFPIVIWGWKVFTDPYVILSGGVLAVYFTVWKGVSWNIFKGYTPLFGCLMLLATTRYWFACQDIMSDGTVPGICIIAVFGYATIRYNNSFIGTLTVLLVFDMLGFRFGIMLGGYWFGWEGINPLIRCLIVSVLSVGTFLFLGRDITKPHIKVFETGVYFWGIFIGGLAGLIIADADYLYYNISESFVVWFLFQLVFGAALIFILYIGNVMYKSLFKGMGGTFLVFWLMDLQRILTYKMGGVTFAAGGALLCLIVAHRVVSVYPQYFIRVKNN